jgi:hypothetical protein
VASNMCQYSPKSVVSICVTVLGTQQVVPESQAGGRINRYAPGNYITIG